MNALQPSFMLAPSFGFLPDRDIHLGTVLTSSKGSRFTKLPDLKRPLNKTTRVPVDPSVVQKQEYKPWSWDSSKGSSAGLHLHADISFLSGIGGGFGGDWSKGKGLVIECESASTSNFLPDAKYLAQTVQDDLIKTIGRKLAPPPLYMITGLMVATGARITVTQTRSRGVSGDLSADGTQVGIPVKLGPEGEFHRDSSSKLANVPTQPFILAYEIIRLKMKRDGSVTEQDENTWALFDDETLLGEERDEAAAAAFERDWELHEVSPQELLSDE